MTESIERLDREHAVLADVLDELTTAFNSGAPVEIEQYEAKYPSFAAEIRKLARALQAFAEMERSAHGPEAVIDSGALMEGVLGDFCIIRELGRGGMGVVYEAHQISLSRRVALKVLPFASILNPKHLQRFHNEAQAAAALKHPNIVSVYSVGHERGIHYYSMELVDGHSLAEAIESLRLKAGHGARQSETAKARPHHNRRTDASSVVGPNDRCGDPGKGHDRDEQGGTDVRGGDNRDGRGVRPTGAMDTGTKDTQALAALSTAYTSERTNFYRSVARIGIEAAKALECAHQMGIVHRDIKPSNLMLDRDGRLCVTDFGLATTRSGANLTLTGDLLGTARYMSPEQASGQQAVVDHRTDIYSLGVTLYELLTLSPAFSADDPRHILRQIEEDQPSAPRTLDRSIPRDLETVVLKATAKDRDARYDSAQQLADDLERFLQHRPVKARRLGRLERLWRWRRRNPTLATFVLATTCLLTVLAIAGPLVAWRQSVLRRRAVSLYESLYDASMIGAYAALRDGSVSDVVEILRQYSAAEGDKDLRGFEWFYLCQELRRAIESPKVVHGQSIESLAFSPDGKSFAYADWWGDVFLRRADTRAEIWRSGAEERGHEDLVFDLKFSPDGQIIATASKDKTVLLWSAETGNVIQRIGPFPSQAASVAFSDGGTLLAVGLYEPEAVGLYEPDSSQSVDANSIHLYQLDKSTEGLTVPLEVRRSRLLRGCNSRVESLSFSCDGKILAAACNDHRVYTWDVASGEPVHESISVRQGVVRSVQFSPVDPCMLVAGVGNADFAAPWGELLAWDLRKREVVVTKRNHAWIDHVVFSKDGQKLAAVDERRTIRVWSVSDSFALIDTLRGHSARINDLAFRDGSTLASCGSDNQIVFWDVSDQRQVAAIDAHDYGVLDLAFNTTGSIIVSGGADGTARIFETDSGKLLGELPAGVLHALSVDVSSDNSTVAVVGGVWPDKTPGELRLWNIVSKTELHCLYKGPEMVWVAQFSPDGCKIAAGFDRMKSNNPDRAGTLVIWDVRTGKRVQQFLVEPAAHVRRLAWSPDGKYIATITMHVGDGDQHGPVQLWNCETETCETVFENPQGKLFSSLAYSPNGKMIAAGSWDDGTIRLWQISDGKRAAIPEMLLRGHSGPVMCLDFSPDGRRLVSTGFDAEVRVWNVQTGAEVMVIRDDSVWLWCARFSHDGRTLAVGTNHEKAKIRFYRAARDEEVPASLRAASLHVSSMK